MSTPSPFHIRLDRRRLLKSLLIATGGILTNDLYAEALVLTPRCTEGPYYPDHLPLDQDNDLTRISSGTPAGGIITELGGRLLDADGKPLQEHVIELWQADVNGCYIHSRGEQRGKKRDDAFQGFGRITTNAKGEYRFRTIKPGLYTGRTLHWHIAVKKGDRRLLTTQLCIAGVPQNDRDMVLNGIRDEAQRLSIIRELKPKDTGSQELFGTWDIILGNTPDDRQMGRPPGPPPTRGEGGPNGPQGSRPGNGRLRASQAPSRENGGERPFTDREIHDALFGPGPF